VGRQEFGKIVENEPEFGKIIAKAWRDHAA